MHVICVRLRYSRNAAEAVRVTAVIFAVCVQQSSFIEQVRRGGVEMPRRFRIHVVVATMLLFVAYASPTAQACSPQNFELTVEACAPQQPWSINPNAGLGLPFGCGARYPIDRCTTFMGTQSVEVDAMSRFHAARGRLYLLREIEPALALKDFDAVLKFEKSTNAYYYRAIAKIDSADYSGALRDLDAAISLDPRYRAAIEKRGAVNLRLGNLASTVADLSAALELPIRGAMYSNRTLLLLRAIALQKMQKHVLASQDFEKSLTLPDYGGTEVWTERCYQKAKYDLVNEALLDCSRAIEGGGSDQFGIQLSSAYEARGLAHLKIRDWQSAISDFERVSQNTHLSNYGLCRAWQALNRPNKFKAACDAASADGYRRRLAERKFRDFGIELPVLAPAAGK